MDNPLITFLYVIAVVALITASLYIMFKPHYVKSTTPKKILSYNDAVPKDYNAKIVTNVLDARDAGVLLNPTLGITKISDAIVSSACPEQQQECVAKALFKWVQQSISHIDALPTRDYIVSPEETILLRQGNDMTMSLLLGSMLRSQGLQSKVAVTPYIVFVQTKIDNATVWLDPGCGGCVYAVVRYDGDLSSVAWIY